MGKKSKSRTQKGNLMFDTSLYDVVKNRPVGGVALKATAILECEEDLEEIEEPLFILLTHDDEQIRRVGVAIQQGKVVYAIPCKRFNTAQDEDRNKVLLFAFPLRRTKYLVRSVPNFDRPLKIRDFVFEYIENTAVKDEAEAKQRYEEDVKHHIEKPDKSNPYMNVCSSFESWCRYNRHSIGDPYTYFIETDVQKLINLIRAGVYCEEYYEIEARLLSRVCSISYTLEYREFYSSIFP